MLSYQSFIDNADASSKRNEYSVGSFKFTTILQETEDIFKVDIVCNSNCLTLHWGLGSLRPREWICPVGLPHITLPASTIKFDEKAAQSPFIEISSTFSFIEILFSKESPPIQLNFVLKKQNAWFNNSGSDYWVVIKEKELPGIGIIVDDTIKRLLSDIIEAETIREEWTLMHRFNLCNSWIQKVNGNTEAFAWIFVWMRYSAIRKLDWQRKYNTRPSELASSQKNLTFSLVSLLKVANIDGLVNNTILIRGILGNMGKGGDNGQRIRDEILQLMHRGKIRTYNEKLAKENYYEQWHQKLHNNTTPDDIGICEAIIAYNETNNMSKYWEVLTRHGITRERLASFERAITVEPYYAPQIISDLYSYLDLLKAVHGSADLNQSINSCKGFLSPSLNKKLDEVLASINNWDKIEAMNKIYEARKELNDNINKENIGQYREILYLDIALEGETRQICEQIIHYNIDIAHLCRELSILLKNLRFTIRTAELNASIDDYLIFYQNHIKNIKNDREIALIFKAACDRIQRVLGSFVDTYNKLIDPKAKFLGAQFSTEPEFVDIFTEEVIRGSSFFPVSLVLKKIDMDLRKICGLKSWQIISPIYPVKGILTEVDSLHSVAYNKYLEPVILICKKVTGEEEIPEGATAVLCCKELDTLAHVCVRARNNKVLLAICFDLDEINSILELKGTWVEASITSNGISVNRSNNKDIKQEVTVAREIKKPLPLEAIALSSEEFAEGKTGAKANNCAELKKRLPKHIGVPCSAALPYGTFEFFLSQSENSELSQIISDLLHSLSTISNNNEALPILNEIKSHVLTLTLSDTYKNIIQSLLTSIGCNQIHFEKAWIAIKQVWGSKFNERVYLSILKSRINIDSVVMSVLCQEVISAEYAFVLHTKNPINNNPEEIYGELVIGIGETLVGAYEGRSLSFIANKSTGKITVESFPNKSVYLKGFGFIFRSDSNSEDLPGFAGAGLFDSFLMDQPQEFVSKYSESEIVTNPGIRNFLLQGLKEVGILIEEIYCGVAQDIEGAIKNNQIFVVQARPQV